MPKHIIAMNEACLNIVTLKQFSGKNLTSLVTSYASDTEEIIKSSNEMHYV